MEFRLLGPLEVRDGGRRIEIAGRKQRAILAMLLLEAGRVVPTSRLLDALWDEPPASGRKALQMAVSGLRKALGTSRDVIATAPGGYRLSVAPDAVDAHRFERMVAAARSAFAEGEPDRAAPLLYDALALWHGPALAEFASDRFAAAESARLEALKEEAIEQRIEADLALGRHAELVAELERLVRQHPLRERLRGQLMRALSRTGRQADALAVYQETRSALVDELGIEPGRELQRLQQAILRQDPELTAPARADAPTAPPVPPEVDPFAATEERKLVTALFADLADSTVLGEQLDAERLRVVLREYFQWMSAVVKRWGGTVEKFIGDAVVGVFGVPAMHEDDAERALAAALEMRSRLEDLNTSLFDRHGVRLALKIGVNTGDVIAGGAGGQFMVTGDAVNAAARLEQVADPGEILVGERTFRAAEHAFELHERGRLALKGKATPVAAWRLVGPRRERARRTPLTARFVGRERELLLLETFLATTVEERRPQLVVVAGHAGIGKSRLVEEFVERARATVYAGRCVSYGQGAAYSPLREILWSAAGILLDDPAGVAAQKVTSLVGELPDLGDAERERIRAALGATAGLSVAPLDDLSPEAVRDELELSWPRFAGALAARAPVILLVEDVHWAEPPLLEMLDRILVRGAGSLLIVVTTRPEGEGVPALASRRSGAHQISLEPLAEPQTRQLLAELLPRAATEVRSAVLEAAEGNPFFLEELARHVAEAADDVPAPAEIPDTVRSLLAARIDALPAREKAVLQDAAVIGRVFWAAALEAAHNGAAAAALAELEDRGLVVTRPTSQLAGHTELAFRHALTREVAYQSIPRARRARAHAAAADWVEWLAGDRRNEFIELIAHHTAAAADPGDASLAWPNEPALRERLRERAVAALVAAGDGARSRFAVTAAFGFAERALELAATDDERLAAVGLKAETAHAAVHAPEAWALYQEALQLADCVDDAERGARLAASATLLWSRFVGAFPDTTWHSGAAEIVTTWLERLGASAETFDVGALLVGRSLFDFDGLRPRAAEDALADARRALAIAESISSRRLLSYAVDALTMLMGADGLCTAAEAGRLAAESRARAGDRWTAHEMLVTAAHLLAAAGQIPEAAAHAREARREAAGLSVHQRIHAAAAETYALVPLGRLRELREATENVPDLVEEEQKTTCYHGFVALAGHVLSAHEAAGAEAARRGFDVLEETSPAGPDPIGERLRAIELLLRIRDIGKTRTLLLEQPLPAKRTAAIRRSRALLQVAALTRDADAVAELAPQARQLAAEACAPALAAIADWSEALIADNWRHAMRAAETLRNAGESYLSARLIADLVPIVPSLERERVAEDVARRLEEMGAATSAAEALAGASLLS